MAQASTRHILVLTLEACEQLKKLIENGADFAECAKKHSICPSGRNGGELGTINPEQLIKELRQALFSAEAGKLLGPVESEFGYHLIQTTRRS